MYLFPDTKHTFLPQHWTQFILSYPQCIAHSLSYQKCLFLNIPVAPKTEWSIRILNSLYSYTPQSIITYPHSIKHYSSILIYPWIMENSLSLQSPGILNSLYSFRIYPQLWVQPPQKSKSLFYPTKPPHKSEHLTYPNNYHIINMVLIWSQIA